MLELADNNLNKIWMLFISISLTLFPRSTFGLLKKKQINKFFVAVVAAVAAATVARSQVDNDKVSTLSAVPGWAGWPGYAESMARECQPVANARITL